MGRSFSGSVFLRLLTGAALAVFVWVSMAGAAEPESSAPIAGGVPTAAPTSPEVKNSTPEAAKAPAAAADSKEPSDPQAAPEEPPPAAAAAAPADEAGGSSSQVQTPAIPTFGADGALRYSYSIDVPAFHGLEPEIVLNYDSGRKTKISGNYQGWLGFGWGLDGFDIIERQRPKGGVPAFDTNDVYLLNGTELVPCAAITVSSPSCAYGGNYTTEVESYQRIRYDMPNTSVWHVTQRDGTQLVFHPMDSFRTTPTPADSELAGYSKWYLRFVIDIHGNTVRYDYNCMDGTVCYPRTIIYSHALKAQYQINFYYQERPDHILMANGKTISRTAFRIRTISVLSNGAVNSAYALNYDQAPGSGNSRLRYIYRYGTDAVIDSAGLVSSGTKLPRMEFEYRDFNTAGTGYSTAYAPWEKSVVSPCTDSRAPDRNDLLFSDLDNDGMDELAYFKSSYCGSSSTYRFLVDKFDFSTALGSVAQSSVDGLQVLIGLRLAGSFLGVQQQKSIIVSKLVTNNSQGGTSSPGSTNCNTVNNVVTFDSSLTPAVSACSATSGVFAEDCTNIFQSGYYYSYSGGPAPGCLGYFYSHVISSASGESKLSRTPEDSNFVGNGDYAGNGILTPVILGFDKVHYQYFSATAPEMGGGAMAGPVQEEGTSFLADVNGDGLTDLILRNKDRTVTYNTFKMDLRVFVSTGRGFQLLPAASDPSFLFDLASTSVRDASSGYTSYYSFASTNALMPHDLDGDGKAEIVFQNGATDKAEMTAAFNAVRFGFGASGNALSAVAGFTPVFKTQLGAGDINGDSLPDFPVKITGGNYLKFLISNGSEGLPNSILSVKNELGGKHSFKFKPSTRYVNQYLPFAMSTIAEIAADDGNDGIGLQKIFYAGGKYDPVLRRFMGFRTVTETRPCAAVETSCPSTETTYRQDAASVGLPERITVRDGAGVTHRDVTETYDIRLSAKPYWAKNTATTTVLTEVYAATLKTERAFDSLGNVSDLKDHGRVDRDGDELRVRTFYTPNTAAFIVDKPYAVYTSDSIDDAAPLVARTDFRYDGDSLIVPPVKGDLTLQRDYQNLGTNTFAISAYAYDSFGNITSETNALGEKTERTYDPLFNLFVTE